MISLLKRRKLRKQLKEYLHMARHARHMREDIADPRDIAALVDAEAVVRQIREEGGGDHIEQAVATLEAAADKVYPNKNRTGIRENVEVVIVALGAAMAIRAFFFQPFKIPTGSMQPTLNGIQSTWQADSSWNEKQPLKFFNWLLTGESYKVIRAKASGQLTYGAGGRDNSVVYIGGVEHKIPQFMNDLAQIDRNKVYKKGEMLIPGPGESGIPVQAEGRIEAIQVDQNGDYVLLIGNMPHVVPAHLLQPNTLKYYNKGDVILAGKVIAGDHILVNKMKYNFMSPERGDISVFDTRNINDPGVRKDTFYIKRMVGLAGEKIQIQNNRIVADGEVVREPPMFETIATDPIYSGGHANAPGSRLATQDDYIQLADDEYLMMGDNTKPMMSLDGRFFGGVPRNDFQGPAIFVYWPFREHWGIVR
ncbi:Signal peptidase I P [Pontiella desulfatans]|uniref:Signal peptidase I n=1 Tax=Pontiella desulfatans TaxID=2750659 RepID=A0A6C2U9I1_PONDE|nr:signal peptidase I [Pontiella desulfatans]VGO16171.1 Signal peptidase I P [Pontiella desulfatans]